MLHRAPTNPAKNQPNMYQKSSKYQPKSDQKSPKMRVRRGLEGPGARSGSHGGPQGGPRTPKSPKTTFEGHPGPPLWEQIFGTFLIFLCLCGKKSVSKHSWKRCCFGTSIFKRNLVSQSPPGTPKYRKSAILSSKSRFSAFHQKWLGGGVLGLLSERFLGPSWSQVGPTWAHVAT